MRGWGPRRIIHFESAARHRARRVGSGMIGDVVRRASCPVLVGRAAEVARLRAALERAAAGEPAVVAYAPLVEALRQLARTLDREGLERVLGGARAELARLVPELDGLAGAGKAVGGPAALAPTRLFELLLGVLQRMAELGPLLLVVEDLHWSDQSTRDLLGFLVRNLRDAAVTLVFTYRSDELQRSHPHLPFVAELER